MGLTTAQRGKGPSERGPRAGHQDPGQPQTSWSVPCPVWGGSGSEGRRWKTGQLQRDRREGQGVGGRGNCYGQRYLFLFSFQI